MTTSSLRAYLELLRLPNVFTAVADVMMGYLVTHPFGERAEVLGLLVAASALLYSAGMVLNDVFDREVDEIERSERPLPSGRISPIVARWLGYELLVLGMACGWAAGYFGGQLASGVVATALAAAVWLYDAWLKRTPLGPLGMGACRALNVLLGMSASAAPWQTWNYATAGGVGLYIAGVTWFARSETEQSSRVRLTLALAAMLGGIGLLASLTHWDTSPLGTPILVYAHELGNRWPLLWALLGLSIGYRALWAIGDPTPRRVQMVVKHSLMSLIILDAVICFAARGMFPWAAAILLLLAPMQVLGRWIYST